MRSLRCPPRGCAQHSCGGRGNLPAQAVYAPSNLAPLASSLGWKSLAAWAPRNGTEAAHMGPRLRGRQGASTFASTRFDHRAGEAMSLGWVGPTGAMEDATLLWVTSPGSWALRQAPGSPTQRQARQGGGSASRLSCTKQRGWGRFHTFSQPVQGRQPPGPAHEPVHPGDLQRLSRPGGRGPGVIMATRKGKGAEHLRNSEEDRTRSRASLQAASRASGESPGAHRILTAPHPVSSGVCARVRGCGSHPRPHLLSRLSPAHIHTTPRSADAPKTHAAERVSRAPPLVSPAPGLPTEALTPCPPGHRRWLSSRTETTWEACASHLSGFAAGLGQPLPAQGPTAVSTLGLGSPGTCHSEAGGTLLARPQTRPLSSLSVVASGQHPPGFTEVSLVLCSPMNFFPRMEIVPGSSFSKDI